MVNFANRNYSVLHFSLLVLQHFISGPSVKMREAFYIYYYFFEYISRGKWMIKDRGGKTIHGQSFFSDCPSERAEEEEMFPPWCQQSKDFYPSKGGPMVKIYAFLSFPFLFSSLLPHSLLQRIFRTQGLNPGLLHCRQILYHLSHQGNPKGWIGRVQNSLLAVSRQRDLWVPWFAFCCPCKDSVNPSKTV